MITICYSTKRGRTCSHMLETSSDRDYSRFGRVTRVRKLSTSAPSRVIYYWISSLARVFVPTCSNTNSKRILSDQNLVIRYGYRNWDRGNTALIGLSICQYDNRNMSGFANASFYLHLLVRPLFFNHSISICQLGRDYSRYKQKTLISSFNANHHRSMYRPTWRILIYTSNPLWRR